MSWSLPLWISQKGASNELSGLQLECPGKPDKTGPDGLART